MQRKTFPRSTSALALGLPVQECAAEIFPTRPVTLTVSFPPGPRRMATLS